MIRTLLHKLIHRSERPAPENHVTYCEPQHACVEDLCCPCDWGAACSEHDTQDESMQTAPRYIEAGDELLDTRSGITWRVEYEQQGTGKVVITPIYHAMHKKYYVEIPVLRAHQWRDDAEAQAKWEAESAADDLRAEMNIPQHLVW